MCACPPPPHPLPQSMEIQSWLLAATSLWFPHHRTSGMLPAADTPTLPLSVSPTPPTASLDARGAGAGAGAAVRPLPPPSARRAPPRLLILFGPTGAGKSTAVRCMAAALGLPLRQWTDTGARGVSFRGGEDEDEDSQWRRGGGGPPFRRFGAGEGPSEFELPFTSVLADFEEFLRNILNRSPLLLTSVGSGGGGSGGGGGGSRGPTGPTSRSPSHPDPALVLLEEVPRPRDAAGWCGCALIKRGEGGKGVDMCRCVCPLLCLPPLTHTHTHILWKWLDRLLKLPAVTARCDGCLPRHPTGPAGPPAIRVVQPVPGSPCG